MSVQRCGLAPVVLLGILVAALPVLQAQQQPKPLPQAPSKVKVTASLWTYSTLCDFADSPNPLIRESRAAGTSLSAEACEELITRWGHPPAVRLTIENLDTADHEIPLDGMSSVTLKTHGKTIAALAYRRKTSQPRFAFTTGITGSWILQVAPAQVIDLTVLFPQAEKGDQVTLGTVGTAKIQ